MVLHYTPLVLHWSKLCSLLQCLHCSCSRCIILELHKADRRTSFSVYLGFDETLTPEKGGREGRGGGRKHIRTCVCMFVLSVQVYMSESREHEFALCVCTRSELVLCARI